MAVSVPNGSVGATGVTRHGEGLSHLLDLLEQSRPPWMADALCREYPDVSWFPEKGERSAPAKAICARCLAQDACRVYGLTNEAPTGNGIWGGLGPDDRRVMRRGAA